MGAVLSRDEKISLGTKEIAKRLRKEFKVFKGNKFSVRMESFSGGSSITVALMKADRKMVMDFDSIPEDRLTDQYNYNYTEKDLKTLQGKSYFQLNDHTIRQEFGLSWCNGVFLTYQGHKLLEKIVAIVDSYHRVESDIQTDYYNTNFFFHLQLGRYDKPFIDGKGFVTEGSEMIETVITL